MRKIDIGKLAPANHRVLRDMNEVMVLNVIREKQPISRIEIAELTGLEGSTISKIVARQVSDSLILEEGVGEASPKGGRKKRYLHINPRKACAIGVDLRPSGYAVALSDFTGKILHAAELVSRSDPRDAVAEIALSIRELHRAYCSESIEGIGVSLVGLVDPEEGRILVGEGLGWGEDVPVGSMLSAALDMDLPIYYENGAWLGALAEIWFGKHERPARNLVFLDVEEGIGAGIIIQGQLYHGAFHGAGEFGHISLHPEGPLCSCGVRGCLEAYAADPATVRFYEELRRLKKAPSEPDQAGATIADVVDGALANEPEAVEAIRNTAAYLGRGLIPIIYSVNPELIVLGGPITRVWDLIYPVMMRELSQRTPRFYLDHLSVARTTLEARPSLVGAIALVLARAFAVPTAISSEDFA